MPARSWAALIISLSIALLLGGCTLWDSPETPMPTSKSDLYGRWEHVGPGSQRSELVLDSNGDFSASDVPYQVFALDGSQSFGSDIEWSRTRDLRGTWAFSGKRMGDDPYVDIHIEEQGGSVSTDTWVLIKGSGKATRLEAIVGPIDDGVTFDFRKKPLGT